MSQVPDQHREKRVELILQQLEELPTLPTVAVRVLEVTSEGNASDTHDVVQLIGSDPALTARILALVHRADLGVRGEVNSVDRAVQLLGFDAVRSAVLAISVFQVMGGETQPVKGHFSREEFWKHCIAVACCAELLADAMKDVPPSDAFICGLLHDLGKVALDAILPKSFSRVVEAADLLRSNIADLERTIIGLDHMVVGKRLAERWQLPAAIRDCTWLHGQHPQALPGNVKSPRLVNLVTLADLLVREQHLGYSGNYTFGLSRLALLDAVGLTQEQVDDAMKRLVAQIEPRAKALGLGQASSGELYQQALAQANRELGRVSGQLASKNRKLSVRAKFFDALSSFQSELRPDAPPQTVLTAIAQTAVGVLGVECAAVFSLPPLQAYAETVLCDGKGNVFQTALVDLPEQASSAEMPTAATHLRPSRGAPGDGPILPCGPDMDWFVNEVSPRLAGEQRFWVCLQADGECVGGIVWGAAAGETQRLSTQVQELVAIANGWSLALRTSQIREEARSLAEQLAEANRQLHTAQSEILRSKMIVSISEMAAGAAHEMNNPLAVISGRSQLLSSQLADPKHKASAHLIYEQSHRLSSIITELMDFAKPQPPAPCESELPEIVGKAVQEAKQKNDVADRRLEVTMGDVPAVMVDPGQIAAALQEILDNALQATDPAKGHVSVHAAFDPYSSRVVLIVSDDGCGMDEETVKRAFDPFFSSKRAGRRRGMGLAKALRWVEASGGSIRLESRPGQGTRTVLLLPAAQHSGGDGGGGAEPKAAPERKAQNF